MHRCQLHAIPALAVAGTAAALALGSLGMPDLVGRIAGASRRDPAELPDGLSPAARALFDAAYADVDRTRLADYHCHVVGTGEGGSGCYVNPRMLSWAHPFHRLKFEVYRSAGRIGDPARAESDYAARLRDLVATAPGRFLLLAFDEHRDDAGRVVPEKTEFHVPDAYALRVASSLPGRFAAAGSVHPFRPGACEALRDLHRRGVRVIKWLPNAMGIRADDPRCDPFYDTLRELGIAILSHGGEEKAVEADEDQCLGNPLLLRRPLDRGVKVIVAHCASLGHGHDHDAGGDAHVPNWDLLLRMFDEPRWRGRLFADISAMTQSNRIPAPLRTYLDREDLHDRLVNGSDYPLPAVNVVIRIAPLVRAGLLDPADADPLREIYDVNPLAFDFVLKRRLRLVRPDGTVARFAPRVFEEHGDLPLAGPVTTS